MVNLLKTATATATFFLAYFFIAIAQYILPPIIDWLTTQLGTEIGGIFYFGYIIIVAVVMLIFPIALMITAITEPQENNPVIQITMGVLYAIFSIAITYFIYFWFTPMANSLTEPLLQATFWASLIIIWAMNIIAVPIYTIIEARKQ